MQKVALITGVTGQDGSYLSELLIAKGYLVHGIIRRASSFNTGRIEHLLDNETTYENAKNFHLHYGDLSDNSNLLSLLSEIRPNEIYNLAAQSHVKVSFEVPEYTADIDALGVLRVVNAIRAVGLTNCRLYQASTSELFGKVQEVPQTETTPFYPRSPYAVAKQFAYWTIVNYREAYSMHLSNGILFNHESPRRGESFVTRKITRAVARIKSGLQKCLFLGNLDSKRDWGHAKEYVEAMWLILQQDKPDDYVCATGKTYTVRHFVLVAFKTADIKIEFHGSGAEEFATRIDTNEVVVRVDPKFFRPTEVDLLVGNADKAKRILGWSAKISLEELVSEMVASDIASLNA